MKDEKVKEVAGGDQDGDEEEDGCPHDLLHNKETVSGDFKTHGFSSN